MNAGSQPPDLGPGLSLLAGGFPALTDRPGLYPGIRETLDGPPEIASWPPDYLLHDDAIWQLVLPPGEAAGQATVLPTPRAPGGAPATGPTIEEALAGLGAAGLGERIPAVAIGSNAYPRQLADKLREVPVEATVPSLRGVLRNAAIVYCPVKARKGYVPVTPFYRPGSRSQAWLQLLTPGQLAVITRTEGTYKLLRCSARRAGVSFALGSAAQPLPEILIYWYMTAFAPRPGRAPLVCRGTNAGPGHDPGVGQQELWRLLGPQGPDAPELQAGAIPNPIPPNSAEVSSADAGPRAGR